MHRERASSFLRALCLAAIAGVLAVPAAGAMTLPPGFQARVLPLPKATSPTYTNGLQKPSTLEFAPDGTIFVAERNGRILAFDSIEDQSPTLVANMITQVASEGDRGLLGMKLDPRYPSHPYIYLSYTYDAPIGSGSPGTTDTHNADGSDSCDTGEPAGCLVSGRVARIKIDPVTHVAVNGSGVDQAEEPPQEVLVNSWCQQVISHSIGDIEFDSSGALLMTGGDGGSWSTPDYGQLGNPCKDPTNEGGSLRAQDVRTPETATDPTDYSGSLIRIDPDTGAALPDNPFSASPLFNAADEEDKRAPRILAYGMRNPFRFAVQPGTDNVYVGDVGWEEWEEIDHATSPPEPGQKAVNFGWPCYEGGPAGNLKNSRWAAKEKPLCTSLYAEPSKVTAPLFAYPHPGTPGYDGHLFTGDECNPAAGSAVAGLSFYDPTGIDPESAFPAKYDGALFFTDASRGCIWTMEEGSNGEPDPATVENFATHLSTDPLFTPVDTVEGPDGALYVPNFYLDQILQIRYFPGNQAPTPSLVADKTYGSLPLKVKFDATGSTDPDAGDHLHYSWDLNGDGQFGDAGSAATAEHEYTDPTNVTAAVRVSDDFNHVVTAQVQIYPGDKGPPSVTIVKPSPNLEWAAGDEIEYEATATDPDGESFGSGLTPHWEFTLQHCPSACHQHPLISSDTASGSFEAPAHEYPSHLKLEFTATDSRGMSATKTVEVFPRLVEVGVESDPAGIPLTLNGVTDSNPFTTTMIAGSSVSVTAPAVAEVGGEPYVFDSWSDGGERIHDVTSFDSVDLVAHFIPEPEEPEEPDEPGEEEPEEPGEEEKEPPIDERPEPETKPEGGGGSSAPVPLIAQPPAPVPPATLRLVSRPAGVRLRLGPVRAQAPFSARLAPGSDTFLLAPRAFRRHGAWLRFQRWVSADELVGGARRQPVTVSGDARYVAVYGPR